MKRREGRRKGETNKNPPLDRSSWLYGPAITTGKTNRIETTFLTRLNWCR